MTYDSGNRNPNAEPFNIDLSKAAQDPVHHAQIIKDNEGSAGERHLNPDPGLPGELGRVAKTVARMTGASQSAANLQTLAIWASCVQPHYNVQTWWGAVPTSLYTFVVAGSGERKSSGLKHLIKGVEEWDKGERQRHEAQLTAHRQTLRDAKKAGEDLDLPEPILDRRLFKDATIPKVTSCMAKSYGVALWCEDEAAKVVGGHSMSTENGMSTFGVLNGLWDGSPYVNDRVLAGSGYIASPRFTVALAGQMEPARKLFGNGLAEDTGLIARFLVVQAPPLAGSRPLYEPTSQDWVIVYDFRDRVKAMLERALPLDEGEYCPSVLDVSHEAMAFLKAYYREVETAQAKGGLYEDFRASASKSVEQAARIAGVLAAWRNPDNPTVEGQDMQAAISLARFYLNEAKRFMGIATQSRGTSDAEEMLKQLKELIGDSGFVTARDLQRKSKSPFRGQRERADRALSDLEKSGQIYSQKGEKGGKRYMLEGS